MAAAKSQYLSVSLFSSSSASYPNPTITTDDSVQSPNITLYQYQICPFCNKAKALLNYAKLDYKAIEVNPLTKEELKPWSQDYRKVPIAKINQEQINGSDDIMESLLDNTFVQKQLIDQWTSSAGTRTGTDEMTMEKFRHGDGSSEWIRFANNDLAPILYPNICRSLSESYSAFGYVKDVDNFSSIQKVLIQGVGAFAMYMAASKVKKRRNITCEREALHNALDHLENDGLDNGAKEYVSGLLEPSMGDIALFGTLSSVKGLEAHEDAIHKRGGAIEHWYARMESKVEGINL